ncbi:MAG: hypothetical protein ACRDGD_03410 [Candidatus Limnocylindria bacterium]
MTASVDAVTVGVTYSLPPSSFTYDANGALTDDGAGRTFNYDIILGKFGPKYDHAILDLIDTLRRNWGR